MKRSIGILIFNNYLGYFDIYFPDGSCFGGLDDKMTFDILCPNGVWKYNVKIIWNGFCYILQGVGIPAINAVGSTIKI